MKEVMIGLAVGVAQGIAEWFPISSSAVIALLVPSSYQNSLPLFLAVAHLGSALALVLVFRKTLKEVWQRKYKYWKEWLLISGITLIIGGLFYLLGFLQLFSSPYLYLLTSLALLFTAYLSWQNRKKQKKTTRKLNLFSSVIVGICQGASFIPGLSRSGVTFFALSFFVSEGYELLQLTYLVGIIPTLTGSLFLFFSEKYLISLKTLLILFLSSFTVSLLILKVLFGLGSKIKIEVVALFLSFLSFLSFWLR